MLKHGRQLCAMRGSQSKRVAMMPAKGGRVLASRESKHIEVMADSNIASIRPLNFL
jgi:hypothetical protein